MRWKRCGLVFSPQQYGLEYAKSPQVIVFEEYVRVYFSACKRDSHKLISYVCYADFTKDFQKVIGVAKQILPEGRLGCFDEHGIFPFSPVRNGNEIWAYTSGWSRRVSVSIDTGIGLAVSKDGRGDSFERVGEGPVLTSSLEEPFLVVDGYVRKFQDRFHMWYIFGQDWKVYDKGQEPDRIYKIGHAVSQDGIEWSRDHVCIIPDKIQDESQALPCVLFHQGKYHMYFCYRNSYDFRQNSDNAYRLGYACSEDMIHWKRNDEYIDLVIPDHEWDSEMQCYPHVFEMDQNLYMLYNGNSFGKNGFGLAVMERN